MTEKIKITHGNGVTTEIPALDIMGTSYVQKEQNQDSYYFTVFKQGGQHGWRISEFESKEDAQAERDRIDEAYCRIMGQ